MNLHHMPEGRYHPTMKQLVWGTIAFLQAHPRVRNSGIVYPIPDPVTGKPRPVNPTAWRSYGGIELLEPGLTIAVYPLFTPVSTRSGAVSASGENKSCIYKPNTLGPRDDLSYRDEAVYRLVVQAFYQDPVTLGETIRIPIDRLIDDDQLAWPQHAYNMRMREGDHYSQDPNWVAPYTAPQDMQLVPDEVFLDISPGEEILREWMDVLRLALCDMPTMLPFAIRSTEVEFIDYPTSTWIRQSEDIFFHTAHLVWRLNLYPPASWRHIYTFPVVEPRVQGRVG